MIKICGDCQHSIRDNEAYRSYPIDAASTVAAAVYFHLRPCRKQPYQSAPAALDKRLRH